MREVEAVGEDGGLDELSVVARGLRRDFVERVECHGAEFEEAEGEKRQALEDDEVHVEEDEGLEGACEHVGDADRVLKAMADLVEIILGREYSAEDGEEQEQVEKGEEEVLVDKGSLNVAKGIHTLQSREPVVEIRNSNREAGKQQGRQPGLD